MDYWQDANPQPLPPTPRPPAALVSASAIGYYGDRGGAALTELAGPGRHFLAELAAEWEQEGMKLTAADLQRLADDGLVELSPGKISVTPSAATTMRTRRRAMYRPTVSPQPP